MKRREFLRSGTIAGGAAVLGAHAFPHRLYAAAKEKAAQDVVTLGKTGIRVSRLFQGTGTNGVGKSSNQTRGLGLQGVAELLRAGVDQGVTVWDLADQYGTHPHAREALKTVARDKVVIMTKTHASSEKEMRADLDRFRQEIGTDVLDIVLLHCMMSADWPKEKAGAMAVLAEAKAKGTIRAHGVSCHDFGALKVGRGQRLGRRRPRPPEPGRRDHGRVRRGGAARPRRHEEEGQGRHRHEDPRARASCGIGSTTRCSTRSPRRSSTASRSEPRTAPSSRTCSPASRRPRSGGLRATGPRASPPAFGADSRGICPFSISSVPSFRSAEPRESRSPLHPPEIRPIPRDAVRRSPPG